MKLEAVIVCINYADFLKVTLPYNKEIFDKIVVVTDNNDQETADVCRENGVECVGTDAFYQDQGKANKARGINEGLLRLDLDGWVVQLDADIWLPGSTKAVLDAISLEETCIYGIDRMMCDSRKEWDDFIRSNPTTLHDDKRHYLNLSHFRIGKRIILDGIYVPIGYFQMWHPGGSGIKSYATDSEAAFQITDTLHARQFRDKRLIPEMICVHLSSERAFIGQNWNGRVSKRFI